MKIIKSALLSFLALAVAFSVFTLPASADTPVAVGSLEELRNMEKDPTASYYLENDIIVTEADGEFAPLFSASNQFKGEFDGKGYSIVGIEIGSVKSTAGSSSYSGIFAYNAGTIKNLNVENASAGNADSKYAYSGIIAGINLGTIENCYVSGSSRNENIQITAYTGGICGEMLKGEIINSVSYANVYSGTGEQYSGGIAGYTEKGTVKQCAFFGSVFANGINATMDAYGGGIVGFSRAGTEFTDCLFGGGVIVEKTSNAYLGGVSGLTYGKVDGFVSYGTLTPSEVISHIYVGGAAGEENNAEIKYAYYLEGTINEEITGKKAEALSKDELLDQSSYDGLDFSTVWEITDSGIGLKNLPQPSKEDVISELVGVEIITLPKKLDYVQGDPVLDLTGLEVSAIYSDKSVNLQQNEYTVGGYNYVIAGKQTITVTYKGFTDTFEVNVAKTTANVIVPSEITQGSYQEGNSNGKPADKKPDSSKPSSTSSKTDTASKNNASTVLGGNVVIDTLDDDETDSGTSSKENSSKDNGQENSSKADGSDNASSKTSSDDKTTQGSSASQDSSKGDSSKEDDASSNQTESADATDSSEGTESEDDEVSSNVDSNEVATNGDASSATSGKTDGLSPMVIVIIIIIAVAVVAAVIVWFLLKSKSQSSNNEVSNEELAETDIDENDTNTND